MLDFLEIGTSDFDTLIEKANDEYGVTVEPLQLYLDRLPNKKNVQKICAAITDTKNSEYAPLFYVHPNDIIKHRLQGWLKGCNSLYAPHDFHINYHHDAAYWHNHPELPIKAEANLVELGIVQIQQVQLLTYKELAQKCNFHKVKYIRVDAEGHDINILNSILNYYNGIDLPEKIEFENNRHTDKKLLQSLLGRLTKVGYRFESKQADIICYI